MTIRNAQQFDWTLITVTYNSASRLREFWSTPPSNVQWIVVDNGSTDDTLNVLRDLAPTQLVELKRNVGFSAANNIGMEFAAADLIGFINPDVTVDFESLDEIQGELERNDWLITPQLLNSDRSLQPNGRGFPLVINKLRNRGKDSHLLLDHYLLLSSDGQKRHVCWVIGAVLLGRRSTFERLGGWDDRFFIYYEDADICIRAWEQGIPTVVLGSHNWVHGWSRETLTFRWGPWRREIASLLKFYSRYPSLVLGHRRAQRRFPNIAASIESPSKQAAS